MAYSLLLTLTPSLTLSEFITQVDSSSSSSLKLPWHALSSDLQPLACIVTPWNLSYTQSVSPNLVNAAFPFYVQNFHPSSLTHYSQYNHLQLPESHFQCSSPLYFNLSPFSDFSDLGPPIHRVLFLFPIGLSLHPLISCCILFEITLPLSCQEPHILYPVDFLSLTWQNTGSNWVPVPRLLSSPRQKK